MVRLQRGSRADAAASTGLVAVVAVVQHLGVGVVDDDRHVGHLRRRPTGLLLDREIGRRVRNEGHLVGLQRVDGDCEDRDGDRSRAEAVAVVLVAVAAAVAVAVAVSRAGAIGGVKTVKKFFKIKFRDWPVSHSCPRAKTLDCYASTVSPNQGLALTYNTCP